MTSSVTLASAALQSVLNAAHPTNPDSGSTDIRLILAALFALVPCDWVRWHRTAAKPAAAIETRTYPAIRLGAQGAAAHELRLELTCPGGTT